MGTERGGCSRLMKTPRHNGGAVHSRSMRKRTQTTVAAVVCKKGFYMSEYLYTEAQVREMWKRTYEEQIGVAQAKAIEAIVRTDGEVVVSLSGGKDSCGCKNTNLKQSNLRSRAERGEVLGIQKFARS